MKNLLFISNLFPNPQEFSKATFNLQAVLALRKHYNVTVVAPIPWIQRLPISSSIPYFRSEKNISVYHPTYWYLPKGLRFSQGLSFYFSINKLIKKIIIKNSIDIIYSSWLFPDGWASSRIAAEFNIPCFIHVAGTDANRLIPNTLLTQLSTDAINLSSGIISVSKALSTKLEQLGCHKKIFTVYNGIDTANFHIMSKEKLRVEKGFGEKDKIILFVGNLLKEKGIFDLLNAFSIIAREDNSFKLIIIGDGKCKIKLTQSIEKLTLSERVFLLGRLHLDEIGLWMNLASLLCLPSHSEGLPNVIIEARACGTPVVATDVGGIPELANMLNAITLVPPKNVFRLASAIIDAEAKYSGNTEPKLLSSWESNADVLHDIFENNLNTIQV